MKKEPEVNRVNQVKIVNSAVLFEVIQVEIFFSKVFHCEVKRVFEVILVSQDLMESMD